MNRRRRGLKLGIARFAVALAVWMPALAQAQTSTEVVEYYHLDALGSVRAVTNQSGVVARTHVYRPFGEGENPVAGADPTRFTGKERDRESGLDYFGARYYASRSGRFTTVDPGHVGGNILNPQSWNAYAYAGNNPLRFIDPDGKRWFAKDGEAMWVDPNEDGTYTSPGEGWVALDPADYNYRMNVAFVNGTLSFIGEDPRGRKMLAPWSSPDQGLQDTTFSLLANLWVAGTAARAGAAIMAEGGTSAATEVGYVTAKGARYANLATNLTAREFQANLISSGFRIVRQTIGPNGPVTILSNGQKTYTIYTATSTGAASAQVTNAAGQIVSKIRLSGS